MSVRRRSDESQLSHSSDTVSTRTVRAVDDEGSDQQHVTLDVPVSSIEEEIYPPQSNISSVYGQSRGDQLEDPSKRLLSPHRNPDVVEAGPKHEKQTSTKLQRATYIVVIVLLYAAVSLFAWVITCILVFRPITLQHYDIWVGKDGMAPGKDYDSHWNKTASGIYEQSEAWFQTARVLQSIASVLTIPVASAVCGSAAVIYTQRRKSSKDISLGQLVRLADKSWSDPLTIIDILFGKLAWTADGLRINRAKRSYTSSLLFFAILLHLLGSVIAPLQQVLLSTKAVQVPIGPQMVVKLTDLPYQLDDGGVEVVSPDSNDIVLRTRAAIETVVNTQAQAQLWPGGQLNCTSQHLPDADMQYFCGRGTTLGDLSKLPDPFLAELTSSFHTGLVRQFIPRINSTATYEQIPESDFPRGCGNAFGAFYVNYQNTTLAPVLDTTWGLQACMPNDNTIPPWKFNRDRQDFTEELYLNITLAGHGYGYNEGIGAIPAISYIKITLYTTAGYFELPNYTNKGVAGPLLDKDPFTSGACDHTCVNGGNKTKNWDYPAGFNPKRSEKSNSYDSTRLELVQNKGPLLTIAMALFGRGSFPQTRLANPKAYAITSDPTGTSQTVNYTNDACGYLLPLVSLLLDPRSNVQEDKGDTTGRSRPCIFNSEGQGGAGVRFEVGRWLRLFTNYTKPERLSNAFTAAAFLANQNWLLNQQGVIGGSHLVVYYDEGMEIQAPVISMTGTIAVSVLLGLYLVTLFSLAVYAAWTPRWTRTLDSFAMMRIGAAYESHFPMNVGSGINDVEDIDRLSGTVGTVGGDEGSVQRLELGAKGRIGPGNYLRYRPGT